MNNENPIPQIFNRKLARLRRGRQVSHFKHSDFLHHRAMLDIIDRLETVKRSFSDVLFHGVGDLASQLTPACGVGALVQTDSVKERIGESFGVPPRNSHKVVYDEEQNPFAEERFDAVISLLTLQGVNDLVGALVQYRRALKPDGLFVAAMFSGSTLDKLRKVLLRAEIEISGGAANRVHPFADIKDLGQALSRAGFALPVTDTDSVLVNYKNPMTMFADLRAMGETCALVDQPPVLRREVLRRALEIFHDEMCEEDQTLAVVFEISFLTGWAPHPDQQQPLQPGSAKYSFEESVRKIKRLKG